jgi:hypothetical protein
MDTEPRRYRAVKDTATPLPVPVIVFDPFFIFFFFWLCWGGAVERREWANGRMVRVLFLLVVAGLLCVYYTSPGIVTSSGNWEH